MAVVMLMMVLMIHVMLIVMAMIMTMTQMSIQKMPNKNIQGTCNLLDQNFPVKTVLPGTINQ